MSDSTVGKVRPKTLIIGTATGLAALALAILAGWLIMKRVGEPRMTSQPQENSATAGNAQMAVQTPAETQALASPEAAPSASQGDDASKAAALTAPGSAPAAPPAEAQPATGPAPSTATQPATPARDGAAAPSGLADASAADTTFELARIEPSGDAVFAGTTGPGARIELFAGDNKIGESSSDTQGNWAVVLDKQLPAGANDIYAVVTDRQGNMSRSAESIAVVIDAAKKMQPLIVAQGDSGSRVIQNPSLAAGEGKVGSTTQPPQAAADSASPASAANQAATVVPGQDGAGAADAVGPAKQSTTVQVARAPDAPETLAAPSPLSVSIEAADYDAAGKLAVSGRAAPGTAVRLYYDNQHVGDALADANGRWALNVDRQLDGGVHAVRADALAPGGTQVAGRAEVSFIAALPSSEEQKIATNAPAPATSAPLAQTDAATSGAEATAPAASPAQQVATAASDAIQSEPQNPNRITVSRGDNLWLLARQLYGRGVRYTAIYDANRDQIRDPDLIFPGQVFLLPRASDSGSPTSIN